MNRNIFNNKNDNNLFELLKYQLGGNPISTDEIEDLLDYILPKIDLLKKEKGINQLETKSKDNEELVGIINDFYTSLITDIKEKKDMDGELEPIYNKNLKFIKVLISFILSDGVLRISNLYKYEIISKEEVKRDDIKPKLMYYFSYNKRNEIYDLCKDVISEIITITMRDNIVITSDSDIYTKAVNENLKEIYRQLSDIMKSKVEDINFYTEKSEFIKSIIVNVLSNNTISNSNLQKLLGLSQEQWDGENLTENLSYYSQYTKLYPYELEDYEGNDDEPEEEDDEGNDDEPEEGNDEGNDDEPEEEDDMDGDVDEDIPSSSMGRKNKKEKKKKKEYSMNKVLINNEIDEILKEDPTIDESILTNLIEQNLKDAEITRKEIGKVIKKRFSDSNLCNPTDCSEGTTVPIFEQDKVRVQLPYWVLQNKQKFTNFMNTTFKDSLTQSTIGNSKFIVKFDKNENKNIESKLETSVQRQQRYVAEFIQESSPYRGLLLYHGLGSGKTAASIFIGEGVPSRKTVILLPKTIEKNYKGEIDTFSSITIKNAKKQNWCWTEIPDRDVKSFFKYDKNANIKLLEKIMGSRKSGLWMINPSEGSNWKKLRTKDKSTIRSMIETIHKYKYTFIAYNSGRAFFRNMLNMLPDDEKTVIIDKIYHNKGITLETWDKLQIQKNVFYDIMQLFNSKDISNPFDDKLVVVDEVHNLISLLVGGGYTTKPLYTLLMTAKNLKLIFLSGTPSINDPFELSILLNLLHGSDKLYNIDLKPTFNNVVIKEKCSDLLSTILL